MIRVYQTINDSEIGDCLRAATASLLELNITQVPHFILYDEWANIYIHFLRFFNIEFEGTGRLCVRNPAESDSIDGAIMATLPSLNYEGRTHSVLINVKGIVIHDPSNGKSWQGKNVIESGDLRSWHMLTQIEEATKGNAPQAGDAAVGFEEDL